MRVLSRLLGPRRCKEGEGILVYWCATHGVSWRPDLEPVCEYARLQEPDHHTFNMPDGWNDT